VGVGKLFERLESPNDIFEKEKRKKTEINK
jgi:hypothetical protein